MRPYISRSIALAAALVTGGVCATVLQAGPADGKPGPQRARTIVVVERATTDTTADTGPKGDSRGDVLAFANRIYDRSNKTRIGSDNGSCVRTAVGSAYECEWSLQLADGQINVAGPFYDSKDSDLAVIGGTGSYVGATGQMHLHARNAASTAYDFTYHLKNCARS